MAEAGTVYVSVVPSMRGFGTRVRAELANLRDVDLNIRPQVDGNQVRREVSNATRAANALVRIDADISESKRKIAETREQLTRLSTMTITPEVDAVTTRASEELQRLQNQLRDLERKRPEVKLDADTSAATTQLTTWQRTVGRVKAVAKLDLDTGAATSRMATLRGLLATTTVGAGLAAATPYLLSLGWSAKEAAGGVALLPAAAGAAAVGVLTLKTAFTGFGDAIGDDPKKAAEALAKMAPAAAAAARAVTGLKPAWQSLTLDVQGRMFAGLATQITGLGNTYIPILRGAMAGLASDINGNVVSAFDVLRERGNISGISTGLGFVRQGLGSMSGALAPLTQAFTTLFVAGAPYIARFGAWVERAARSFSLFIGQSSRAGLITVWIDRALLTFRQLGTLAGNLGSIFGSLFSAAGRSGESLLSILARVTGTVAAALKSPEGAAGLAGTMGMLRDLAGLMWQRFVTLWPAIAAIGRAFFDLMVAAAPITNLFISLLVPAITAFAQAISWLSPVLGPLLALYAIWTAAQWALNLAMMMNPITGVIALIVGLVAGVIYAWNNFTWFREAVMAVWSALQTAFTAIGAAAVWLWQSVFVPAWQAIAGAVSWAWTSIIWPVLQFLGTALAYLGIAIFTVLVAPYVIAWNVITGIISWAWNTIISPIFYGLIMPALTVLGAAFTYLWHAVIVPVWQGITNAIRVAWAVVSGIFLVAMGFIRGVLAAAWFFLWNGVIVPVWNGIRGAIAAAWSFIQTNIFNPIVGFLRGTLGPVFQWLLNNIITPVWNGIRSVISGAWSFIQGVFNTGKAAVQSVGQAFQNVADWVGRAWATIREAARGPVQFVVDVVYNNGIRPVWNGIAGLFGMAQLNPVRFAEGGVLPGYTPGRDVFHNVALSGGEGILVPEAVRALGPSFVGWANRTFSGGRSSGGVGTGRRYADGGIVGAVGDFISGGADFFMDVFTDPASAVKKLFGGVLGDGARTPGRGGWTDSLKKVPGKVVEGVIAKVKKWIEEMASFTGGAGGNWAPVAAQALAITGQPQSLLWRVLKQIQIESGGNPRAINNWDINAKRGTPSKGLIQTIDPTFQAYRHPGLPNNPYHPLANIVAGIRYAIARYGSIAAIWPKTMGYDRGGILPPGVSMARNDTGAGEHMAVFTTRQWDMLGVLIERIGQLPRTVDGFVTRLGTRMDTLARTLTVSLTGVTDRLGGIGAQVQAAAKALTTPKVAPKPAPVKRSNAGRPGYVQAEDGSWVPRSFYGFDSGGLGMGRGVLLKDTIRPERVLSPRQTAAFERLVPLLASRSSAMPLSPAAFAGEGGRSGLTQYIYPQPGQSELGIAAAAARRAEFEGRIG